jgi:hypothetical protein
LTQTPTEVIEAVTAVGMGTLLFIAGADLWLTWKGKAPLGYWISDWARRWPAFALSLVAVTGALVGHFFWAT